MSHLLHLSTKKGHTVFTLSTSFHTKVLFQSWFNIPEITSKNILFFLGVLVKRQRVRESITTLKGNAPSVITSSLICIEVSTWFTGVRNDKEKVLSVTQNTKHYKYLFILVELSGRKILRTDKSHTIPSTALNRLQTWIS